MARALGVAVSVEGTVRRRRNRVRITIRLVNGETDETLWSDSYDRHLSDIFAIQSEVAQTIASKLTAALSPEEKKWLEARPTQNLEAYDLYLHANGLIANSAIIPSPTGNFEKSLLQAVDLLQRAVEIDSKFALAYCAATKAHYSLYFGYDLTPTRCGLGDEAIVNALRLEPELPEAHLGYAYKLYICHRDYEHARKQLAIARRGLPNNPDAIMLEAFMNRRQGNYRKAIQEMYEAVTLDPRNPMTELANSLWMNRQFSAAARQFDRAIQLAPDHPILKVLKAFLVIFNRSGDRCSVASELSMLPVSIAKDRDVITWRLISALYSRDWHQVTDLVEQMKGGEDDGGEFFANTPVPVDCYLILTSRFQGERPDADQSARFSKARERLKQKVQRWAGNARQLSKLAIVDAMLGKKEDAISDAKRAVEMLPISKDAVDGPSVLLNLAEVYAWTNEPDSAFETMNALKDIPNGLFYGDLKRGPAWDPLRKDPRFDKLLAELAPKE